MLAAFGRDRIGRVFNNAHWAGAAVARLAAARGGQISVLFALVGMTLITAVGGGIDLGRAYFVRQQLSNAALLTCQYAGRSSVLQNVYGSGTGTANGTAVYQAAVSTFLTNNLIAQKMTWPLAANGGFTYAPTGGTIKLAVNLPATILSVIGVSTIPTSVTMHCLATPNSTPPNGSNTLLASESFENSACTGTCYAFYSITGQANALSTIYSNTPGTTAGYVGTTGTQWVITGYCVEVDSVGVIRSTVPDGTHSAELDCDNGHGSAGNSSISTKVYLQATHYELRWSYASRVGYAMYYPSNICGSTASDVAWANDTNSGLGTASRTNQINAYLDADSNGSPPVHTTLDGTQQLAGSNLIDVCTYAADWVQRVVEITVTTPGWYWLSFAADGASDSYGGQIDNILLCQGSCSGSAQDNFAAEWAGSKELFHDGFESPVVSAPCPQCGVVTNLDQDYGTSGTSASGWVAQPASGWTTSPDDHVAVYTIAAAQGGQSVGLDASSANRTISRKFLLEPGYYEIDYDYISNGLFSGVGGPYCVAAPSAGAAAAYAIGGGQAATNRLSGAGIPYLPYDSNIFGVFMSNAQLVSAPSSSAQNPTATYTNPDGSVTARPTVPLDAVNLGQYNSAQPNQLIDLCGMASSWQVRKTYVRIMKTGWYWLSFAALGTADGVGAVIDEVHLIALGSPYMASPPSNAVVIPAPNPQPGATLSFTGFSITAENTP